MHPRVRPVPATLILILLLALAWLSAGPVPGAGAARYTVAQCGWKVGSDGDWLETANDKFTRSSWCGVPAGSDAWDGVHVTSGIRGSTASISGNRFARWRWSAPPGTGIVTVSGDRWHVLKDGFQHRLGSAPPGGLFQPFAEFASTDTGRRPFSRSFSPPAGAFESRLLCALPSDRYCSVTGTSLSGVRGLTISINDPVSPGASLTGLFLAEGWLRGTQTVDFTGSDAGSGVRLSETLVDGALRADTVHDCAAERIAGQLSATRMQPCRTAAEGRHTIDTARLSDGPHRIVGCATDFAGNRDCTTAATLRSDNNAPSAPRGLSVTGGSEWQRTNPFALEWVNPDQGPAAPLTGTRYRITGPDSYDSGVIAEEDTDGVSGLRLPRAGEFTAAVWLVDAAGNENPEAAAEATLRFDDVDPVAFVLHPQPENPELLRATVFDEHSGPDSGAIAFRRQGNKSWRELPTRLSAEGGRDELRAFFPSDDLPPGRYEIRVRVRDRAGNETISNRRPDGSRLVLNGPLKVETRLQARLFGPHGSGRQVKVPFGRTARVVGRLTGETGRGVAGVTVALVEQPGTGARSGRRVRLLQTGADGGFVARLAAGTSRRVTVSFAGDRRHAGSSAGDLRLGVLGSISFKARPSRLATGEMVRFEGQVSSGAARQPARGSLVAIRYFEQGAKAWRPVLVTRTDRFGRYRASYRFRYITGVAKIRLRATLLPSSGFPYLSANSVVKNVRVRG